MLLSKGSLNLKEIKTLNCKELRVNSKNIIKLKKIFFFVIWGFQMERKFKRWSDNKIV